MRRWLRSPLLLRYFVGQHILNGLSVAAGVMSVGVAGSLLLGFAPGQAMALGAISASISDLPAPWRVKARRMGVGFGFALLSTSAVQLVANTPLALGPVIGAIAFASGMLTGYGRWALPLSMQALIPMVFAIGLPHEDLLGALRQEILLALGGVIYIGFALLATIFTDASSRRLMTSECLREFAEYLKLFARFYDVKLDPPAVYGAVIRQQAALSEQLQGARALLLDRPTSAPMRLRLAATIGILLDAFDALVAAQSRLADLRATPAAAALMARIGIVLRAAGLDLQRLSLELLANAKPALPADHRLAADALRREAGRLAESVDPADVRASSIGATTQGVIKALDQIRRLELALSDDAAARQSVAGVDLAAFRARASLNPKILLAELTLASPVFRFAARLAMAMMAGAFAASALGEPSHGNWILLTIAVILRANYGLTLQRRDDRVIGTLIGCAIAAPAATYLSVWPLILLQGFALALTHGYVRLNYRLSSIGASITALISLHLIDPTETVPVVTRFAYTLVGAALAHLFSYVFPRWEFREAPQLATRLQAQLAAFARIALDAGAPDQAYRLARKSLIEALAALSDSAARMGGEPQSVQRGLEEMAAMLVAAFDLSAQISAARQALGQSRGGANFAQVSADAARASEWLGAQLASHAGALDLTSAPQPALGQATLRFLSTSRAYAFACEG